MWSPYMFLTSLAIFGEELEEEEKYIFILFYLIKVQLLEYTLRPVLLYQK